MLSFCDFSLFSKTIRSEILSILGFQLMIILSIINQTSWHILLIFHLPS